MRRTVNAGHVTPAGANIFAELGFPADEAQNYLAESARRIAQSKALKESLLSEVACWIGQCGLTRAEIATKLSITNQRLADITQKKPTKFTIDSLADMLVRVGKEVRLQVR